jgi:hypothetical protein
MTDSGANQGETIISFLLKQQSELIQAKTTLGNFITHLCEENTGKRNTEGETQGEIIARIIHKASGDDSVTSIWHLEQIIKYLEAILADNQMCVKLIKKMFSKN